MSSGKLANTRTHRCVTSSQSPLCWPRFHLRRYPGVPTFSGCLGSIAAADTIVAADRTATAAAMAVAVLASPVVDVSRAAAASRHAAAATVVLQTVHITAAKGLIVAAKATCRFVHAEVAIAAAATRDAATAANRPAVAEIAAIAVSRAAAARDVARAAIRAGRTNAA